MQFFDGQMIIMMAQSAIRKKMPSNLPRPPILGLTRSTTQQGLCLTMPLVQEFLLAYHTEKWGKLRHFGAMSRRLQILKERRDTMYDLWKVRERKAGFSDHGLYERGKLYRHPDVRIAIGKFWTALAQYRDGELISEGLFKTLYEKIDKIIRGKMFDRKTSMEWADVEWKSNCSDATTVMSASKKQLAKFQCGEGVPPPNPDPDPNPNPKPHYPSHLT